MSSREPSGRTDVHRPSSMLARLRERGVLRVAASYAVIAWLLLQIASVVFDPLGVPKWVMTALIIAAAVGFPIAIALAWFLEIGEHGIELDLAADGVPRPTVRGLRHYADAVVIGVLLVAVVVLLVRQSDLGKPKPPANPAIAVLPFENLSGDPQQEYFSDGLAEETLDRLGRVPGLRVIARSSSFSFKGSKLDARSIAEKLGVTTLLEGSVRRDGKHLKLSARLVDGATGQETWSGSFDREMTDVFKVQAELARTVVDAIIPAARGEVAKQTPPAEADLSAYEMYLLARTSEWQRTPEAVNRTVELLQRSIDRDQNYAPSHAQLALSLYTSIFYAGRDPKATREQMKREAHAALALDPDLPAAQLAHALASERDVPNEQTLAELRRIAERNPNYSRAMSYYAGYIDWDHGAEVRRWLARVLAVDPLAISPRLNLISSLYDAGDMKSVARELERYEELHSGDAGAQFSLARWFLRGPSDLVRAARAAQRSISLSPPSPTPEAALMLHRALVAAGDYEAATQLADRTDWSASSSDTLTYEQALAAGTRHDIPALMKAIESLRALPTDPARDSALLLWLTVADDCAGAIKFKWPEGGLGWSPNRNYTLTGFELDDSGLAYDWCTYHPKGGDRKEFREFQDWLAEEEKHLATTPRSVDHLIISAAQHSINLQDEEAIRRLRLAVERAPLAIRFNPAYPWFARLAGHPDYDRLVEKRLRAQAEARAQIAAVRSSTAPTGPAKP